MCVCVGGCGGGLGENYNRIIMDTQIVRTCIGGNYCIKCLPYIYALIGRNTKITSLPKTEFGIFFIHLQQSPDF